MAAAPGAEGAPEGRYRTLSCIGVGQKSDSFDSQDLYQGGREVVRRLFHEDFSAENPDLTDLIFPKLAGLSHPNLGRVIDYGMEEGKGYLVREKVEGLPILEALQGANRAQVLTAFAQLLLALDYLYSQNTFHLSLKPSNIMVNTKSSPWELKVVDYGIAPIIFPPTKMESNTVGTPPYTAPEYAIRRVIDVRSDLYSVGILLYQALSQKSPFQAKDTVSLLQAQLKQDPPPLQGVAPGVSPKLSNFVQRLLARDPQSRFSTPRQALKAFLEAAEDGSLAGRIDLPDLFSDPEQLFRDQEYLKLFRRVALQGGRWAITGESGNGKTFLAKWLERLFILNQKPVLRLEGENIALLEGEHSLNPSEPTYVLIDNADRGPVEAWLRARPYAHIVALVEDKAWTKKKSGWQLYPLKSLDAKQIGASLEASLGVTGDRIAQEWFAHTQGKSRAMVQHGQALVRQGIIQPSGLGWRFDYEKYLAAAGSVKKDLLGDPLASLPEAHRRLMAILASLQVPVAADTLVQWTDSTPELIAQSLGFLLKAQLVGRMVRLGQEFYLSNLPPPDRLDPNVGAMALRGYLEELYRLEWHREGSAVIERYFAKEADPALALMKAKFIGAAGNHAGVFAIINSAFVQGLKPQMKSLAFEILGRSLLFSGKAKQAEAAFRNAYTQYRADQDHDGQARVLMYLGIFCRNTGDQAKAVKFFQQSIAEAEQAKEADLIQGNIELHIGDLYAAATDFENAEARYLESLQKLGYASQEATIAKTYGSYAEMCLKLGDPYRAELLAMEGLRRAIFKRSYAAQGGLFSTLAKLQEQKGNLRGAAERLAEAVYVLAVANDPAAHLKALIERASFYETNRELILASQDANEALVEGKRLGDENLEGQAHLILGKILRRDMNRLETALQHLDVAFKKLEASQNVKKLWECLFERAEIERYRENPEAARHNYEQALQRIDLALTQLVPGTTESQNLTQKRDYIEMTLRTL